jgi:hypothetical protein
MMKKLMLFTILLVFMSCGSTTQCVKGTICMVGNEPFTNLAVQVDSVTLYSLVLDEGMKNELIKNQGRTAEINFSAIDTLHGVKSIKVKKYKLLN